MRLLLLVPLVLATACRDSQPAASAATPTPAPTVPTARKSPAEARAMIAAGATVIDVRSAEEFADDHLASAKLVPIDELPNRIEEVSQLVGAKKDAPIVVYCASGGRATKAQKLLTDAGFTRVVNGGGLDDLK